MRLFALILALALTGGCAHQPTPPVAQQPQEPLYEPAEATALVFAPTTTEPSAPLMLWRDLRRPSAAVGFEHAMVTHLYLRIDDRQSDWYGNQFERRAVIERTGYIVP